MGVVHITLNGMPYTVPDTYTILEAAREAGIKIPTPVSYTHLTLPTK